MTAIPTMRERPAGQMVIDEFLREQAATPPRSATSRVFGRSPLSDESRPWYLGAVGEIAVGRILAQLPAEWIVFHALPVGTKESDVDHVVVGPGGVFTLNTKHHSGKTVWVAERTLMVNGQKQSYIRNSEHEADRIATLLHERMPQLAAVQPVIVLVDPKSINVKKRPDRVEVLDARRLLRWLTKRPVVLDQSQIDNLAAYIDDPAVWRSVEETNSAEARLRFDALNAEVRSARTRRALWRMFGSLLGIAAVSFGASVVLPAVIGALIGQ